jgi:hypothetical protein
MRIVTKTRAIANQPELASLVEGMYSEGKSYRDIAQAVSDKFFFPCCHETIRNYIRKRGLAYQRLIKVHPDMNTAFVEQMKKDIEVMASLQNNLIKKLENENLTNVEELSTISHLVKISRREWHLLRNFV